jgi:diguanylate cyclase (GGDEF)-like protein
MRTGEVFLSSDVSADRRLLRVDTAPAAAVGLPLECRGGTVGALVAIDRVAAAREPRFERATFSVLKAALEPAALALDNAMRMQRAEALSVTDDLTQLYNSRYLSQVLRRETKRASRSGRPLSLLFIDLDGFKSINDSHGHLYGSRALVEAASVIRASARETDIVARFGGDEFALVLPDTGSDGAMFVGERIREKIAAWSFLRSDGLNIALTVSVGVATLPDAAASAEELIQAADEAMYEVKDRGKNGIHVAGS